MRLESVHEFPDRLSVFNDSPSVKAERLLGCVIIKVFVRDYRLVFSVWDTILITEASIVQPKASAEICGGLF